MYMIYHIYYWEIICYVVDCLCFEKSNLLDYGSFSLKAANFILFTVEITRQQKIYNLWYLFCAGRITVLKCMESFIQPLINLILSLLKTICYPEMFKFSFATTSWGCQQDHTVKLYRNAMVYEHEILYFVSLERAYIARSQFFQGGSLILLLFWHDLFSVFCL